MNFEIIDNGKTVKCNIVKLFSENNINYIVYTDGTKDLDGDLEIYASRYEIKNNEYVLNPIEFDYEWDLIDERLMENN